MSANEPYDRFGNVYNVTRLLQADNTFNLTAYEEYSPLYLPATYAMTYLLAFALSTCVIVHTLLYHGRSLLNGFKNMKVEKDDIHAKLMRNYPEVPDWWYLLSFCFFFCLAIVAAERWHTGVPVWALLLSVALPILYVLPSGFIFAMTGQGVRISFVRLLFVSLISGFLDHIELVGANYSWHAFARKSAREYGFQSILGPNAHRSNNVCSGFETWTLHQGASARDFPWCVSRVLNCRKVIHIACL